MKMIHCADLHLDSKMSANLEKEKGRERKAELLDTFLRMVAYAADNDVCAIILAGDLFDTNKVSALTRNTVSGAISRNPEIEFYYLQGNHDAVSFLGELEEIPANLKLFGRKWTSYPLKGNQEIRITGIEVDSENCDTIYDSLMLDTANLNLVVLHGQDGEYLNLGALRNKGIDYLALGHIHAYKKGKLDARGIYCYPGCLEGRGFDECGEHGFVVLEMDEQKHICSDTFIPFASRTLYTVEVDISGCRTTSDITERTKEHFEQLAIDSRSLVKLILTGTVDVVCEKDCKLLQRQFEPQFYFLKIRDESKYAVDYNSFLLDESLKGEFVRTVMASSETEEMKSAIIRFGIQALEGEEID